MYNYISATGIIIPDTQDVVSNVQADFTGAFGSNLSLDPETPQGLLINEETLVRQTVLKQNAQVANQFNPNLAQGIFLDISCSSFGIQRLAGTPSTVSVNLTGVAGTVIPVNSIIQNPNNNIRFLLTSSVTLDQSGNGVGLFQSSEVGAIGADANSLTSILNGVIGWETATNPLPATLGNPQESDEELRARRNNILALNANGNLESIKSGLYSVTGVKSATVLRNDLTVNQTVFGVEMLPNSIYACVNGGTDSAVADMLDTRKAPGVNYTNNAAIPVTVNVIDPVSRQPIAVLFDRPSPIAVLIKVTVASNSAIVDPESAIMQAIIDLANGDIPGYQGFQVSDDVSVFDLAAAINYIAPQLKLLNLQIALKSDGNFSTNTIPIAVYEIATILMSDISVIVQ